MRFVSDYDVVCGLGKIGEVFAFAKVKLLCSEVYALISEVKFALNFAVGRNFTHISELHYPLDNFTCLKGKLSFCYSFTLSTMPFARPAIP